VFGLGAYSDSCDALKSPGTQLLERNNNAERVIIASKGEYRAGRYYYPTRAAALAGSLAVLRRRANSLILTNRKSEGANQEKAPEHYLETRDSEGVCWAPPDGAGSCAGHHRVSQLRGQKQPEGSQPPPGAFQVETLAHQLHFFFHPAAG
jgi:hypothetical protein